MNACKHQDKTVFIRWGVNQNQATSCCAACAKLIFESVKPQVAAGLLPFIVEDLHKEPDLG